MHALRHGTFDYEACETDLTAKSRLPLCFVWKPIFLVAFGWVWVRTEDSQSEGSFGKRSPESPLLVCVDMDYQSGGWASLCQVELSCF